MTAAPNDDRDFLAQVAPRLRELEAALNARILGQQQTVRELLIAFLAGGHAFVSGVPGLAKTMLIRSLAELLDLRFARIQFTPDLMPSDITGTSLLVLEAGSAQREFRFLEGPVFTNLLLADEINRTPPKTQAALLEAMEEGQISVAGIARPLPRPFFVFATQNPIEQEGTYPLPNTQLDRFLICINMDYPSLDTELEMIATTTASPAPPLSALLTHEEVNRLIALPMRVPLPNALVERATRLVRATRPAEAEAAHSAKEYLSWGAGPRAVQAILNAARALAVLDGRATVTDGDYEQVVLPSLRHRILLNVHADAEEVEPDRIVTLIREEIGDRAKAAAPVAQGSGARLMGMLRRLADPSPAFVKKN